MKASDARIFANQQNALKSTGPTTPEGKERSRANAYKHGLTGSGVVMPEEQAAEVERLALAFQRETQAPGEVGAALARTAARMSVRMDACFKQQTAAMTGRVRRAMDEVVPPEGADAETVALLRDEAGNAAFFETSREACLARKYEAAAERQFFRALRELRVLKKQKTAEPAVEGPIFEDQMGSFLLLEKQIDHLNALIDDRTTFGGPIGSDPLAKGGLGGLVGGVDVPISIGRRR